MIFKIMNRIKYTNLLKILPLYEKYFHINIELIHPILYLPYTPLRLNNILMPVITNNYCPGHVNINQSKQHYHKRKK